MASTNHTPNLNLNQWEPNDPVIRQDFNADNAKIDAAVAAKAELVFGTYVGDGTSNRTIQLGFTPRAVFLITEMGTTKTDSGCYGGLFFPDHPLRWTTYSGIGEIVDDGFKVGYGSGSNPRRTNVSNEIYHYWAAK